jgi:diacylglycerol kinase family enzyme
MSSLFGLSSQSAGGVLRGPIPLADIVPPLCPDINSNLIIVSNPVSGNGRAAAYVRGLEASIRAGWRGAAPRILGTIDRIATQADREERISEIADALLRCGTSRQNIIISVGGDGTFGDASEASLRARFMGIASIVVPAPAGVACDVSRELGVPKDSELLLSFIATARRIELSAMTVFFGDEAEQRLLMHSLGCGVSGAFFAAVEADRRRTGHVTIPDYLRGLVKGVRETEPFLVSVDEDAPVTVGEVLTLTNSTGIGGVTRVPLPPLAGRLHRIPVDGNREGFGRVEQGVAALADVFGRGMRYLLGDARVIDPQESIAALAGLTLDLNEGERHSVRFFDRAGNPKPVPAVLNGDPIGRIPGFIIEDRGECLTTFAAPGAAIMIRRGGREGRIIPGMGTSRQ